VLDGHDAARHEAAERDDRHRHVHVEDLLDEALVGVERGVEEDERGRRRNGHDGGYCQGPNPFEYVPVMSVLEQEVEDRYG
jgi:hypothetical protein